MLGLPAWEHKTFLFNKDNCVFYFKKTLLSYYISDIFGDYELDTYESLLQVDLV